MIYYLETQMYPIRKELSLSTLKHGTIHFEVLIELSSGWVKTEGSQDSKRCVLENCCQFMIRINFKLIESSGDSLFNR